MADVDWLRIKRNAYRLYNHRLLYQPIDHPVFKDWKVARKCQDRLQSILEVVNPVKEKHGLDIGSCTGWFSHRLAEQGAKMVGVELNSTRVEIARTISLSRDLPRTNPNFVLGRFEDYLALGRHFDFALCLSLLQHYMRRSLREAWDAVDLISRHCDIMFLDVAEKRLPIKWSPQLILDHSEYEGFTKLPGDEDYAGGRPFYVFRRV